MNLLAQARGHEGSVHPQEPEDAAEQLGVPVIHISTDYVFDGSKPAPYIESDVPNPVSVYGASKLAGEQAVLAASPNSVSYSPNCCTRSAPNNAA